MASLLRSPPKMTTSHSEQEPIDCGEGKAVGYHVRTLCWEGPCDGQVMFAPIFPVSWFTRAMGVVTFPDGLYLLERSTREQLDAGRHLFTLLGEPRHGFVAWVWKPGIRPADLAHDEILEVTHRKVRIFALSNYDDGAFLASFQ